MCTSNALYLGFLGQNIAYLQISQGHCVTQAEDTHHRASRRSLRWWLQRTDGRPAAWWTMWPCGVGGGYLS